jgi:hypothetical protein
VIKTLNELGIGLLPILFGKRFLSEVLKQLMIFENDFRRGILVFRNSIFIKNIELVKH